MMHHSENIFRSSSTIIQNPEYVTKFNGSFFQKPIIQQALSTNNTAIKNVFKSKCQKSNIPNSPVQSTDGFPSTMKMMNLKIKPPEARKICRWHLRVDVKKYLKRKYSKPSHLIPLEAFQLLRQVDPNYQKKEQQQRFLFRTDIIYIFKPFYFLNNLKYALDCNPKVFEKKDIPTFSRSILSCCLRHGGLDNFMMTSSNLYLEDTFQAFAINYTSFAGLQLVNNKQQQALIQTAQFFQIFPHLSPQIFRNGLVSTKENARVCKYSKIRSALINILCLILKRDIYFQIENGPTDQVTRQIAQRQMAHLQKHCTNLLAQISQKKYQQVMKHFCKYSQADSQKQNIQALIHKRKINLKLYLSKVLIQQQLQITWQNILDLFYQQTNIKEDQQIEQSFKQLHEYMWNNQTDKEFYESRGISGERLYIPIKLNAQLPLLLVHKHWYYMFLEENYNFLNQPFCYKLIKQFISKYKDNKNEDVRDNKAYTMIKDYMIKADFKNLFKDKSLYAMSDNAKETVIRNIKQ